jgi:hypothetical protein
MSFHTKVVAMSFNLAPSNTRLKLEVGVNRTMDGFSAVLFQHLPNLQRGRLMKQCNLIVFLIFINFRLV